MCKGAGVFFDSRYVHTDLKFIFPTTAVRIRPPRQSDNSPLAPPVGRSRTSANVVMFRPALILVSLASANGSCDDLDGWKTDNGKGCGWIGKKPGDRCSEVGETSEDVKADRVCAACGNVAADVATCVRSARGPPPSPEVTEHPNLMWAAAGRIVELRVQGLRLGRE